MHGAVLLAILESLSLLSGSYVYDRNKNLVFEIRDSVIFDSSSKIIYTIDKTTIYDKENKVAFTLRDHNVYDREKKFLYCISGSHDKTVYERTKTGFKVLYTLHNSTLIYDRNGRLLYSLR